MEDPNVPFVHLSLLHFSWFWMVLVTVCLSIDDGASAPTSMSELFAPLMTIPYQGLFISISTLTWA